MATSWKRAKVNGKGRQGASGSALNESLSSDLCKSLQMPSFIKSIKPHYCLPLVSLIWLLMSETTVEINLKLMFLSNYLMNLTFTALSSRLTKDLTHRTEEVGMLTAILQRLLNYSLQIFYIYITHFILKDRSAFEMLRNIHSSVKFHHKNFLGINLLTSPHALELNQI